MLKYQKIIQHIKSYPYILDFIKKHHFDDAYLDKNLSPFIDCAASFDLCNKCKGLDSCKQAKKGEQVTLNFDDFVYNDITYCSLYKENKREERIKANYIYSDIPDEYKDLNLKNINVTDDYIYKLLATVNSIVYNKRNKGLYIYGDLGAGKTYMCIALANTLALNNEKVAFIKTNFFVNKMRQLIINDQNNYDMILEAIKKVPYLIVDDIGSEAVSTYSRDDLLFNILDYRMENKLITVFTSNLSKVDLLEHYTYDRNNMNKMKAKRLLERIDILSDDYALLGNNKRRKL